MSNSDGPTDKRSSEPPDDWVPPEPDPETARDEIHAYQVGVAVLAVLQPINDELLRTEQPQLSLENVLALLVVGNERMGTDTDFASQVRHKVRSFARRTVN